MIRKLLSLLLMGLFLAWVVAYVSVHGRELAVVGDVSPVMVGALLVTMFLSSLVSGIFNKIMLDRLGVRLGFVEWFGLAVVSTMWNYLTPLRGGAAARAAYLKRVHGFALPDFLGTMAMTYVLHFFVNAVVGALAALYLMAASGWSNPYVLLAFLAVIVISFAAIAAMSRLTWLRNSRMAFARKAWTVVRSCGAIMDDGRLLSRLLLAVVFSILVNWLMIYFAYAACGARLGASESLLVSSLLNMSTVINITPGSFGVMEPTVIVAARMFAMPTSASLLAVALVRATNMVFVVTAGTFFSFVLGRALGRSAPPGAT